MAEVKSTKKDQPMLDPIAYRSDYSEDNIIGDEKATVENTSKYTGEGTKNVYHPYNKTLTIDQLDPNYQYGQPAKDINHIDDSYITRRNDMIASALYNEGKITRDEVINFLQSQNNWFNSTDEDRATTIDNVYNRIGQFSSENPKEEETKEVDTSRMESDLNKSTAGEIFGKTTADSGNPEDGIKTIDDANSVFKNMNAARIARVNSLLNMDDNAIAVSLLGGGLGIGEQAISDFQQYYPERYANVMAIKKQLIGQMNIDAITSGGDMVTDSDFVDTSSQNTTYAVDNASLSVTATQLLKSIDSILESNDTAKSANELMGSIEGDMAKLKNRLKNLEKEANTVFKGDAPDYLVKAYMNNKSQEIQNQLSILEDRYNAAYSRWRDEVGDAQWQSEYNLKKDSLALDEWKAKNTTSSSPSSSSSSNYTVAERNNNPTNMTVGFMQWAGAELGVDYEVSTDSFWSNGKQLYYAKLIGDPIQTTINVLNKAIAQGKNPFNTTSWSYINKLGLTVDKWNKMSQEEKEEAIRKWLPYEGGNMENMDYYVKQNTTSEGEGKPAGYYNPNFADIYSQFLQGKFYTEGRLKTAVESIGGNSVDDLRNQAEAWKEAQSTNETATNMLRAVEYLMSQGASKWQRQLAVNDGKTTWGIGDVGGWLDRTLSGDAANYNSYYHYIKDNMTLDHLVELKNNGATFGALSNQELDAIGNAALALSSDMGSYEFNSQLFTIYNKLRKNVGERELSRDEFDKMIGAESDTSKRGYYLIVHKNDSSSQSEDDKLSKIGTGTTSGGIDFNKLVTEG